MISIFHRGQELLLNPYFAKAQGLRRGQEVDSQGEFIRIFKAHKRFQLIHQKQLRSGKEK